MSEHNEVQLEILANGIIQVLITTVYIKADGSELTRENWRTTLNPNEFQEAEQILDEYHMNIVRSVWTKEVINNFERMKDTQNQYGVFL